MACKTLFSGHVRAGQGRAQAPAGWCEVEQATGCKVPNSICQVVARTLSAIRCFFILGECSLLIGRGPVPGASRAPMMDHTLRLDCVSRPCAFWAQLTSALTVLMRPSRKPSRAGTRCERPRPRRRRLDCYRPACGPGGNSSRHRLHRPRIAVAGPWAGRARVH